MPEQILIIISIYKGVKFQLKPTEVNILGMEKNDYFKKEVADFFVSQLEKYFEENKISDSEKILIIDQLIEEFK